MLVLYIRSLNPLGAEGEFSDYMALSPRSVTPS